MGELLEGLQAKERTKERGREEKVVRRRVRLVFYKEGFLIVFQGGILVILKE